MHRCVLPRLVRVVLLLPLLALAAVSATADEKAPPAPFADAEFLAKHLTSACDEVEAITGLKYETRPTVQVSDPDTVAKILDHELESIPEEMMGAAGREAVARGIAKFLMAKYEPARHVIHVLPSAVELVHELQDKLPRLGESEARVLLAHEATHAMDFKRYGLMELRGKLEDHDAHQALNAVVEGHAQFVAEEAAQRWGLDAAFARLTLAIAGEDSTEGTATQQGLRAAALSQIRFAYVQGHAFFRAVAKARGGKGVIAALQHPPTSSRHIEHPALWLDPAGAAQEPDLKALIQAVRPLIGDPAFSVVDQRALESALKAQALRVPKEHRKDFLKGFQDARTLVGTIQGRDLQVVALLGLFDAPEHAALFVRHEHLIVESAQATPGMTFETRALEDGAGKDGKLPGFFLDRVVHVGDHAVPLLQQVVHQGRFVLEVVVANAPFLDRKAQDAVIGYACAFLEDPVAAAKLPKPSSPQVPAREEEKPDAAPKDAPKKEAPKPAKEREPAKAGADK